ncbi:hypothetical protein [Pedobacter sp. UYP1]|uniref:hypothetical protein n=1 Tax=Pedobacter sp. UYP1 TaxID=1756396 RepID=UPI003390D880
MQKPNITRTLGQIHFEDLEPHRFEDLVRQLIYDYKDWQSIEATGRGGADDGYDIRAYEKHVEILQNSDDEITEPLPPMEGRRWMIQCKREKEIGAAKVKKIIDEGVNPADAPYGYILAASANISKKTYDAFRDTLRAAGVMEFYLWGKAELEDLLLLPKNDRILFTFFGISLVTKRQSKTAELRSRITVKNKLIGLLGSNAIFHNDVLIRDLNDEFYPFDELNPDFSNKPGWKKYTAFEHHPLGIWCHVHEYFGYIDLEKKEYDYVAIHDFVIDNDQNDELTTKRHQLQMSIRKHWELLPKHKQVHIKTEGLLKFEDIVLIDPKGDTKYEIPHLFIDYQGKTSPFYRLVDVVDLLSEELVLKDFRRIKYFKDQFEKLEIGKIHTDLNIDIAQTTVEEYAKHNSVPALYSLDSKYAQLNSKDVILLPAESDEGRTYWMVTAIYTCKLSEHLANHPHLYHLKNTVESQLKKNITDQKKINVYEIKRFYD